MTSTTTKLGTIIGTTAVILLLDWFFSAYALAHGLESKTQAVMLGSFNYGVPIQWLPVAGILVVSLVTWYEVYTSMFPRRGIVEVDAVSKFRLLRVIAVSLALFVCLLYVPYIIGSNWFWVRMSETSRNISQVRDFANGLLSSDQSAITMDPVWQYSLAQFLATTALVLAALVFGRVTRRPRRLK